jgi:NAD(P)-dependent dehydrogenase (short-subunit alcohol dehydrogenase family)
MRRKNIGFFHTFKDLLNKILIQLNRYLGKIVMRELYHLKKRRSMTQQVLISGSNRGIGLAFVQQYLEFDAHIFATCRDPQNADALQQLQKQYPTKISILKLEITDTSNVAQVVKSISKQTRKIDVLINNAAIQSKQDVFGKLSLDEMTEVFRVNVAASVYLAQQAMPLIEKSEGGKIINISSTMGSIGLSSGGSISYSASKTAINMFSKSMAVATKEQGAIVVALDPGWNRTDMGSDAAPLDPNDSTKDMIALINAFTMEDSGKYYRYSGEELPW